MAHHLTPLRPLNAHTHTHLSSRYISLNTLPSAYDHWYQAWRGSTYFRVVKARTLHTQALCCIVAWHTVQQSRCHNTQSAVIIMTHAICPLGPPRGFARGWHQLISRSRLPLSRQFFCRVLSSEKKCRTDHTRTTTNCPCSTWPSEGQIQIGVKYGEARSLTQVHLQEIA